MACCKCSNLPVVIGDNWGRIICGQVITGPRGLFFDKVEYRNRPKPAQCAFLCLPGKPYLKFSSSHRLVKLCFFFGTTNKRQVPRARAAYGSFAQVRRRGLAAWDNSTTYLDGHFRISTGLLMPVVSVKHSISIILTIRNFAPTTTIN